MNGKRLPTAVHYMPGATIFGCLGVWHVSISLFVFLIILMMSLFRLY